MSQAEVERFLGRIITDSDFRRMAMRSLKNAIGKEGIVISKREMAILSLIDLSKLGLASEIIDDSLKRASRISELTTHH